MSAETGAGPKPVTGLEQLTRLEIIGPHPFETDERGGQRTRIGTFFPEFGKLITAQPDVHALQRVAFIERTNKERADQGLSPLTPAEEEHVCLNSVDLIFEPDHVLIRPDPERMDLALAADELLQTIVSKRQIKFLSVSDRRVRDAIKRQGECWRLSSIPKTVEEKKKLVFGSRVGVTELPIYFYNRLTGTRWLTCEDFERLSGLDDRALSCQLQEIAVHSNRRNRFGRPELDFFGVDLGRFGGREFEGRNFRETEPRELRAQYDLLRERFRASVHESFRRNDCHNKAWCERMLATLFLDGSETETEQILSGLSPEFYMQVEWLPGGRFEEGEFLLDPIFDEALTAHADPQLRRLCDLRAKGMILNLLREYGDIAYVNLGRVPESLSLGRPQQEGRRGVYLVEFKLPDESEPRKRLMRFQKWGTWEHLDEGKDLLRSIQESDEYTDYCLDRRLGCRQLGMNLASRVVVRRLIETYTGRQAAYHGTLIRTSYFEREYLPGIASDKLPWDRYARPGYAEAFARLLGEAAVPSIVVGRTTNDGVRAVFDDGDEVVWERPDGMPSEILVADHTGAFAEYQRPLESFAAYYARPINLRQALVPDPRAFAEAYIAAFRNRFLHVQGDYRKRRRAFDRLFKHCPYDVKGSFGFRWECVLRRLDQTNADTLVSAIQQQISAPGQPLSYPS